jgi:hypothetical protein
MGLQSSRKVVLSIDAIESENAPPTSEHLAVPFWFDHKFSKVVMADGSNQTTSKEHSQSASKEHKEEEKTLVKPLFSALPGLQEQLDQLSQCVERVNRHVEERYRHIAGCVPIMLHGATGKAPNFRLFKHRLTASRHGQVCHTHPAGE